MVLSGAFTWTLTGHVAALSPVCLRIVCCVTLLKPYGFIIHVPLGEWRRFRLTKTTGERDQNTEVLRVEVRVMTHTRLTAVSPLPLTLDLARTGDTVYGFKCKSRNVARARGAAR